MESREDMMRREEVHAAEKRAMEERIRALEARVEELEEERRSSEAVIAMEEAVEAKQEADVEMRHARDAARKAHEMARLEQVRAADATRKVASLEAHAQRLRSHVKAAGARAQVQIGRLEDELERVRGMVDDAPGAKQRAIDQLESVLDETLDALYVAQDASAEIEMEARALARDSAVLIHAFVDYVAQQNPVANPESVDWHTKTIEIINLYAATASIGDWDALTVSPLKKGSSSHPTATESSWAHILATEDAAMARVRSAIWNSPSLTRPQPHTTLRRNSDRKSDRHHDRHGSGQRRRKHRPLSENIPPPKPNTLPVP